MSCDWRIRANGQPSCGAPILPAAVRWRVAALKEWWLPAAMAHARSKSSRLAAFSCTSHGQMWTRCPHSLSAPQGVVASRRHSPMCGANPAAWRPSSCTSHGQMWARCPHSLKGTLASKLAAFFQLGSRSAQLNRIGRDARLPRPTFLKNGTRTSGSDR